MQTAQSENGLDYIVIGAGPAGIQLGYFLGKAGRSFVILDRASEVGSFFRTYPRHRTMISVNKIHTGYVDKETNMRWDWNSLLSDEFHPLFKDFSKEYFPPADALIDYLAEFVRVHGISVELGTTVTNVERVDECFRVEASDGRSWLARRLVIATGVSKEFTPPIEGIELCERYGTMSLDAADYMGQRVLIIGKGNSAFETADHLVPVTSTIHLASPRSIRLAWHTHFVGDLRAINNNVLDTYQLKIQNALLDGTITRVRRDGDGYAVEIHYTHANGEVEELYYDRVILCAGFCMDTSIFGDSVKPQMTDCGRFPLQTSAWESQNVEGLYFAGTLMQQRDYKKYMSAFIHGFRYNVQALARHLLNVDHEVQWPKSQLAYSARAVREGLVNLLNRSSAIWQQPGFLAYPVHVNRTQRMVDVFEPMPMDYIRDHYFERGTVLTLSLEYGKHKAMDPFAIDRAHPSEVERSAESSFLHPIVRCFESGQLVSEHHIMEALSAEWREPQYVDPLLVYLHGIFVNTSMVVGPDRDEELGQVAGESA